jgi:hypothetical protein
MQSLCDICKSIPYDNLPAIPEDFLMAVPEQNLFRVFARNYDSTTELGWRHKEDLSILENSAAACPLCKLLLEARRDLDASFTEAMKDERFSYYDRTGGPREGPLELLQRADGAAGFVAAVKVKKSDAWFVFAGVNFSTREGQTF